MSPRSRILDSGRDTVTVFNDEPHTDSRGNPVTRPSAVGIVVRGCTMQPIAANKVEGRIHADYRLLTRSAAIGPWSIIQWKGKTLHVIDGPYEYGASPGTAHVMIVLREVR